MSDNNSFASGPADQARDTDPAAPMSPAQPPSDTYLPPGAIPPAAAGPAEAIPETPAAAASISPEPIPARRGPGRATVFLAALFGAVIGAGLVTAALYLVPPAVLQGSSAVNTATPAVTAAPAVQRTPAGARSIESAAAKVLPSVVNISVRQAVAAPYGLGSAVQEGQGSGVVLRADGYILTNNHVVDGAQSITVRMGTEEVAAKVIGADPTTDLAVIKIDRTGLIPAALGSSAGLVVGQEIIAVGSPFGLDKTVTAGIVSALNRSNLDTSTGSITAYTNLIQSDAAINPGNSGGALADLDGRVVGINALIESPSGNVGAAQSAGIGFSIPIDFAKDVAEQLIAKKTVAHAYMGIGTVTLDSSLGQQYSLGVTSGALVQSITKGSPADKAGIKMGDVIVKIGGTDITTVADVYTAVRSHKVGDTVDVVVMRGRAKTTLSVTLASDAAK